MNILAVTSVRNEAPHILEWIAHHLAIGIGHFLIFSNDCDDGTDEMLAILQAKGLVTHVPLQPKGPKSVQWQALKLAGDHNLVQSADWVLVSDCDEFVNLRAPLENLGDLIEKLPQDAQALAMPWRLFGNAGQIGMDDQLTCDRFTMAAPMDISLPLAWFFKSLFKPDAFRKLGVHRPKRKPDTAPVWVDGNGNYLGESFAKMDGRINMLGFGAARDLVQLNHYSVRSAEDFMVKRARGLPNHRDREIGLGYWVERNFNTVSDDSIQRSIGGTRAVLDGFLALSGMDAILENARNIHQSRFQSMLKDRENIQLFWHLCMASTSQPPTAELARQQVARIRNAD